MFCFFGKLMDLGWRSGSLVNGPYRIYYNCLWFILCCLNMRLLNERSVLLSLFNVSFQSFRIFWPFFFIFFEKEINYLPELYGHSEHYTKPLILCTLMKICTLVIILSWYALVGQRCGKMRVLELNGPENRIEATIGLVNSKDLENYKGDKALENRRGKFINKDMT